MPSYLYMCKKCQIEMEVIRTVSEYELPPTEEDGTISECPHTEHEWERRIAKGSGKFILQGYGWARDGYGS